MKLREPNKKPKPEELMKGEVKRESSKNIMKILSRWMESVFLVLIAYLFVSANVVILFQGTQLWGILQKGVVFQFIELIVKMCEVWEDFEQRLVEVEWDDSENLVKEYVANIDV